MDDLKRILEGRAAFYAKADLAVDTSAHDLDQTFKLLRQQVRQVLRLPLQG
jgi:XRE family aerobic/anaerobic benzoate catabolism transcriptional regulator